MAGLKLKSNVKLLLLMNTHRRHTKIINSRRIATEVTEEDGFRVLELYPVKKSEQKKGRNRFFDAQVVPPREKRMAIDQDWPSVWPTAKTYRPSVVPLPLYQGYDQKRAPPGKNANAELMKIPNFLHLTPPAIERHCVALKQFCTEWPKALKSDEDCKKHFPVEIITSDFCHSSPTIRDERSRIVTLKVGLKDLNLDYHGRDKVLRLIGNARYEKHDDTIIMVADRCPLRKQNYDYLIYLLTAIHHESWVTEPWEHEKTEADMEKFFFEGSRIKNKMLKTIQQINSNKSENKLAPEEVKESKEIDFKEYGDAVTAVLNEGENNATLRKYKDSVLKSLSLITS